jgi:predicted PurR-regulated permease PerM
MRPFSANRRLLRGPQRNTDSPPGDKVGHHANFPDRISPVVKDSDFTVSQKRALAIATVIAVLFAAYFLRGYFILIVVAAVTAYLFNPLYDRLRARFGTGLSATLTLLAVLGTLIIPLSALCFFAFVQISSGIQSVSAWVAKTDLSALGDKALRLVNETLSRVPFMNDFQVTPELLQERMSTIAQSGGEYLIGFLQGAAGGLIGGITAGVLFIYVFISLLTNREQVAMLIRKLNPLGEEVTDLYLEKMGAMVKGTVSGQFVIALAQGISGAASIFIAGFHEGFFIFAVLLTALSVIPLGGGILSIPVGIGMILFGNVWGGIFVIAFHLIVVTNIDNVLRPILVPREARLDSALMLLAVFAGITMFGFWGLVIGPVVMIVVVTTISVYLAVYKGVPLDQFEEDEKPDKPGRLRRLLSRAWKKSPEAKPDAKSDPDKKPDKKPDEKPKAEATGPAAE